MPSHMPEDRADPAWAKDPSFVDHGLSPVMRIGLHLVAEHMDAHSGDDYDALGSAVMIHPLLAITAKHVIEDYLRTFGVEEVSDDEMNSRCRLSALQIISDGPDDPKSVGVRYRVWRIHGPRWCDLALLRLEAWSEVPASWDQRCAHLTVAVPRIEDRAVAFGYHRGRVETDGEHVNIVRQPSTSVGEVTEIHLNGRPGAPWAHFTTNALYKGGMSGGLVLNDDGHVCGLIAKSMPGYEGEPHYSVVSLLFPLMALEAEFQLPGDDAPQKYPLLELGRRGLLCVDGLERLELIENEGGVKKGIKYRA